MRKLIIACVMVLVLITAGYAGRNIALKGGTFYTNTKGTIEDGILLIKDGKIIDIGRNLTIPEGYDIIQTDGKVITPGFILAYSQVGMEGDGIFNDYIENTDPITPQMRAIDGFYPFSRSIPRLRNRGSRPRPSFRHRKM